MDLFFHSFEKQQMVFSIDWRKWDTVYRYFLRYGMARPVPSARRRIWVRRNGRARSRISELSLCVPGRDKVERSVKKGQCDDQFDKLVLGLRTWLAMATGI